MTRTKQGLAFPGISDFYWSRFSSYREFSIPASSEFELLKEQKPIKGDGEPRQYLLSAGIAPFMLARFLKVRDSQSAISYFEEYGAPLNFPTSDIDIETILGLANSLRAVMGLIELVQDESAVLSDSIVMSDLPPWNRCESEFYDLSYSHILKTKLRSVYPGKDHWEAFVECFLSARAKGETNCSDLETLVMAFYKEREIKTGEWLVPRLKEHFYPSNLQYALHGAFATMQVPQEVFDLPSVSSKDWQVDRERQARYVFGNALKKWFDILFSTIHPTLIWCWSLDSNDYRLAESFSLDTPWNLMCMELRRNYLGKSKYSYCDVCGKPFIRSTQAKGCSDGCKQKRYRERSKARKEGK